MKVRSLTGNRVCARCVMDTTDPEIWFDGDGICNRCRDYETTHALLVPGEHERAAQLERVVRKIKAAGERHEYDCVVGISGGVDSTYLALMAKRLGLRPLAVHMDNGWDSELAVSNIEGALNQLGIDLYTHVLDWEEFRDLQLAFLRASTPDAEIPTDHAIMAVLMNKAEELGIRHILYGANVVTEGLAVSSWSRGAYDWKYIRSVHGKFGTVALRSFPHFSLTRLLWLRYVRHQQMVYPLNYIDYNKKEVEDVLKRETGWRPYEGKHHESIYTRFFQTYILPRKFGYDKRKIHLSTLVMSGQIERAQALEELKKPPGDPEVVQRDKEYVAKKLGIAVEEFDAIMALPPRSFFEFPSYERMVSLRAFRSLQRRYRETRAGKVLGEVR